MSSILDEEIVDEEEVDYEDELDSEDLSEVDDDDLMKRLEAKYGKISGENSEDDDDPDAWTSNKKICLCRLTNLLFIILFDSVFIFSLSVSHII